MNEDITVIALDAMGGDHGPSVTVPAAIQAVDQPGLAIALVGDAKAISAALAENGASSHPLLQVVPSDGVVMETDNPAQIFRSKPRASIFVSAGLVKMGKAQAFVSMGSTGASIAAATVALGTMEGIARGTLGGPIIGYAPNTIIIALRANIDISPNQLADFGALGSVMSRVIYGQRDPRIALLNVGSEATKGNALVKDTAHLLRNSDLNCVGMIEANERPFGKAEVVLCAGFIGNIVLKLTEGLGKVIAAHVRRNSRGDALADEIYSKTNPLAGFGGGPLLGVNGTAIVGHASTRQDGIASAIETAREVFRRDFVPAQQQELRRLHGLSTSHSDALTFGRS